MSKHGPIDSPMEWVPGDPMDINPSDNIHDGEPGLEKGSGGRVEEVTYYEGGAFGKVPMAEK